VVVDAAVGHERRHPGIIQIYATCFLVCYVTFAHAQHMQYDSSRIPATSQLLDTDPTKDAVSGVIAMAMLPVC
jgi:hypothetical protein